MLNVCRSFSFFWALECHLPHCREMGVDCWLKVSGGLGVTMWFSVRLPIKHTDPENRVQHVCTCASRIILAQVKNVLAC